MEPLVGLQRGSYYEQKFSRTDGRMGHSLRDKKQNKKGKATADDASTREREKNTPELRSKLLMLLLHVNQVETAHMARLPMQRESVLSWASAAINKHLLFLACLFVCACIRCCLCSLHAGVSSPSVTLCVICVCLFHWRAICFHCYLLPCLACSLFPM